MTEVLNESKFNQAIKNFFNYLKFLLQTILNLKTNKFHFPILSVRRLFHKV